MNKPQELVKIADATQPSSHATSATDRTIGNPLPGMSDAEIIKHLIDSCNECYEGPDTPDPSLDYANELIARYEAVKTDYKCLQESMYEEI